MEAKLEEAWARLAAQLEAAIRAEVKAPVVLRATPVAWAEAWLERPAQGPAIFSAEELAYCRAQARPAESLAVRWAAKRAALAALGLAEDDEALLAQVHITADERRRPLVALSGVLADREEVLVTLTHEGGLAVAAALALAG